MRPFLSLFSSYFSFSIFSSRKKMMMKKMGRERWKWSETKRLERNVLLFSICSDKLQQNWFCSDANEAAADGGKNTHCG